MPSHFVVIVHFVTICEFLVVPALCYQLLFPQLFNNSGKKPDKPYTESNKGKNDPGGTLAVETVSERGFLMHPHAIYWIPLHFGLLCYLVVFGQFCRHGHDRNCFEC